MRSLGLALLILLAHFSTAFAEVHLVVWTPQDYEFPFILPVRDHETPQEAWRHYLEALAAQPEELFSRYVQFLKPAKGGSYRPWNPANPSPMAVSMINSSEDLKAYSPRLHRILDQMDARGAQTFVLPIVPGAGLSPEDQQSFARQIGHGVDVLFSPGGPDIDPRFYGQANRFSHDLNPKLDEANLRMIQAYLEEGHGFFFGICKGCQYGCILGGCSLHQDLKHEVPGVIEHSGEVAHGLLNQAPDPNSPAGRVLGPNEKVRIQFSNHHQAAIVPPDNTKVRVAAVSDEKNQIVEFVEFLGQDGRVRGMGVQFHPERDPDSTIWHRINDVMHEEAQRSRDRRWVAAGHSLDDLCARDFRELIRIRRE
jgi:putative glutamine amidotransferase